MRGVINVIAWGFAGEGSSATARKRHLRAVQVVHVISRPIRLKMPPITFTDADFKGFDPLQDNLMVITVEIENFAVMKTLVDQGSSVDILYWRTFKKLKILGKLTYSLLRIRLSASLGSEWIPKAMWICILSLGEKDRFQKLSRYDTW